MESVGMFVMASLRLSGAVGLGLGGAQSDAG